ncbi:hypothetical protein [Halostella salina]|uniref:hypothetical protein n=1 Tax=Halostella salina TaxID=1547897 RepID=UPI000EF79F87|nr:hypothetical protein [Halostella salina]
MHRRQFIASATGTAVAASIAGCSGNGDDSSDGGGNPTDSNEDDGDETDTSTGTSAPETDTTGTAQPTSEGSSGGAASPQAAVETYVEAGQENDAETMAAIVHPDGSATTSPESGGGSDTEITVLSMTTSNESDTQASVTVEFEVTRTQDGEEQTRTVETVYQVRTYQGGWYVYAISSGS